MDLIYGPQIDLTRVAELGAQPDDLRRGSLPQRRAGTEEVAGVQSRGLMDEVKHFAMYDDGSQVCNGFAPPIPTTCATSRASTTRPRASSTSRRSRRRSQQAKPTSAMCAYSHYQITGTAQAEPTFACQNAFVLNTILRDQWAFRGFVLSDYGGTHSLSILQGLDTEFPGQNFFGATLRNLADPASPAYDPQLRRGAERSVARILYPMERFGLLACASASGPIAGCSLPARPTLDKGAGIERPGASPRRRPYCSRTRHATLPLAGGDCKRGVAVVGPTVGPAAVEPGRRAIARVRRPQPDQPARRAALGDARGRIAGRRASIASARSCQPPRCPAG